MPLLTEPSTEQLEDHFFGSGAFQFGWFHINGASFGKFPVEIAEIDEDKTLLQTKTVTAEDFNSAIKKYAETLPDRSYDDLLEDMDAADVDCCLQFIMLGEVRYS